MKDLQRAEDEIEALYDLLQAYENDVSFVLIFYTKEGMLVQ